MGEPLLLENVDLAADADARWIVKDERVWVEFAGSAGELQSAVGVNHYQAGDALLTGSTGDRWCVSRCRFDAKYRPETVTAADRQSLAASAGQGAAYRNIPNAYRGKQMISHFYVARSAGGDVLSGNPGDWLVEYAPGDYGIVAQIRFNAVYRVRPAQE